MTANEILKRYNISDATLRNWKKLNYIDDLDDISSKVIDEILKKKNDVRRNKRNSVKNIIPVSYVNDKNIVSIIEKILDVKNMYEVEDNEVLIEAILKILNNGNLEVPDDVWKVLGDRSENNDFIEAFKDIGIDYEDNNDFLGCLYMSLLSVGKKDVNGIYYTPFGVVNQIIQSIDFRDAYTVVDPGCGSGNFLIQAYKKMKNDGVPTNDIIENLYGFDVDDTAVLLSKINIYVLDRDIFFGNINVYNKDFLNDDIDWNFDIVIGNPPWGKKYTSGEKLKLESKYGVNFSKMDSFSQFILRSFEILNDDGVLGFVLPSSFLNIAVHEPIRKFLLDYKIDYIRRIGREFEEVVTDVIIIKVEKTFAGDGDVCLYDDYEIVQTSFAENPYSNFLVIPTISMGIINKIKAHNHFYLVDNVDYAIGIVTGNNKEYLSSIKLDDNEPIISGKEIDRYNFDYSKISKYIKFEKNKLQQVAKEDVYRCKNKIIYKFVGKKLCFAVEPNGMLTLNSANVICFGEEYDVYYISAILNSRITQVYFEDVYDTHKVLKNHIQSFCIPEFALSIKNDISALAKDAIPSSDYSEDIEDIIYRELGLTVEEIEYIRNRF